METCKRCCPKRCPKRKLGEILMATPKATGAKDQLKGRNSSGGSKMVPPENKSPTLEQLGLSKKELAEQWLHMAWLHP